MKNTFLLLVTAFIVILFSWTACKDKCGGDFGIQSIQPAANPVGYEIFIACKGVTANTKVRFDAVDAASVKTAEGGLIAKVPAGISGTVSLSIEEGECSDSKPFDVLGAYPGNVPPSPTVIVIPQAPDLGGFSGITNNWINTQDDFHRVQLTDDPNSPGKLLVVNDDGTNGGSEEQYFGIGNDLLKNNPVSGSYDIVANTITIVIDRSGKPGGSKETYTGQFMAPTLPTPNPAKYMILLTSATTGRQLVLYYPL